MKNRGAWKSKLLQLLVLFIIAGAFIYYKMYFTPKDSLELFQAVQFADNFEQVQKLIEEGHEDNFTEKDFNAMQKSSMFTISQFTLFEYYDKSYVIMTSPGTERLKILSVDKLPDDIRQYFSELVE